MNKTIILLIALLVCVSYAKTRWFELKSYSFEDYEKEYKKFYEDEETRAFRKQIFLERLNEIRKHNAEPHSWKKGVNQLTDRTDRELRALLGYNRALGAEVMRNSIQTHEFAGSTNGAPNSIDWRDQGVVTPVKDQGSCGSCWAFGSSETVESHWAIQTGELADLSEQQIASCTPNPNACGGTGGCQGGIAELAYEKIISYGGLASEWTYPYISYHGKDFACNYSSTNTPPVAKMSTYKTVLSNDYSSVLNAVSTQGPLAVNVDASDWHAYESGVFTGCNQQNPVINHVVQLVGYGVSDQNQDYWLVRNSWAPTWGEIGYIRLERSSNPSCGVDLQPQDGTGCSGGPANVTVCGACGILYSVTYPVIKV